MTILKIPTSTDPSKPLYSQVTSLGGRDFEFVFEWNQRTGQWFFSINSTNGAPLVAGLLVHEGYPIYRGLPDSRLPGGVFLSVDLTGKSLPAGLEELGKRVELVWSDEVNV